MKPLQLANLLNITPVTLRRWAGDFRTFLSPNAQREKSAHRSYDERDIRIFAWIATLRLQNESVANIHETLKRSQANDWRDLPQLPDGLSHDEPVPMMPVETAIAKLESAQEKSNSQIRALIRERDELSARLDKSEQDNAKLREQLYSLTEQIVELLKRMNPPTQPEPRRRK